MIERSASFSKMQRGKCMNSEWCRTTPPLAPTTATPSPAFVPAALNMSSAVWAATGSDAAVALDTELGSFATRLSEATQNWASDPDSHSPNTRSPFWSSGDLLSTTVPAKSCSRGVSQDVPAGAHNVVTLSTCRCHNLASQEEGQWTRERKYLVVDYNALVRRRHVAFLAWRHHAPGLSPAASTLTSAWPALGLGTATLSRSVGAPSFAKTTARIVDGVDIEMKLYRT